MSERSWLDANQRAAKERVLHPGRTGHCAQQPANGGGGRLPFPPPVRPALLRPQQRRVGTRKSSKMSPPALPGATIHALFWYVRKHPTTLLPYQVWRHTVGTPAQSDALVYEEKDETFYVSVYKTTSQQFVVILSLQRHHQRSAAAQRRTARRRAGLLSATA
ncbi:protease 2 [Klebsiella pneumoniae subsp. rhinoscleromatis]|nr:protease 2 [Klebsiella pneumoniae subsp. rhinoscleromatis]